MTKEISVIYCFPRSGGTLLNQCLLCHPANVILSEVNPAGSVIAPELQAADSFTLVDDNAPLIEQDQTYLKKIEWIQKLTQRSNRSLCLRDWTGLNFLSNTTIWVGAPSMRLEQRLYLLAAGFRLNEISLLRRSRAVYESIRTNIPEFQHLSVDEFANSYRAYLEQISPIPKFHLEELTRSTKATLHAICDHLNLGYADDFEERFHQESKATGNNTLMNRPASATWTSIHPAPPPLSNAESEHFDLFQSLDTMAGYENVV